VELLERPAYVGRIDVDAEIVFKPLQSVTRRPVSTSRVGSMPGTGGPTGASRAARAAATSCSRMRPASRSADLPTFAMTSWGRSHTTTLLVRWRTTGSRDTNPKSAATRDAADTSTRPRQAGYDVHISRRAHSVPTKTLTERRSSPSDRAQSEDARGRRIPKVRKESLAARAWEREYRPAADPAVYERDVLPRMRAMSTRSLVAITGLSKYYLWKLRRGQGRLHPRFWESIRLAGDAADAP